MGGRGRRGKRREGVVVQSHQVCARVRPDAHLSCNQFQQSPGNTGKHCRHPQLRAALCLHLQKKIPGTWTACSTPDARRFGPLMLTWSGFPCKPGPLGIAFIFLITEVVQHLTNYPLLRRNRKKFPDGRFLQKREAQNLTSREPPERSETEFSR